ncbi:MAG TPA: crossover junction endodeoxyribonuclease RuvC [Candidatus Paceibacterota bacterium]|nr:crossover junction endodeoxyribonuclease RuvC [Candidatus Paceibacterota bacterium]
MIILGVDPGTRRIGYGIIESAGNKAALLDAGILKIESSEDIGALRETKEALGALIKKFKPSILAVEKLYFAKNQKTALAVAQARGVLLLCGAENGLEIREFAPNEVKLGITGYGLADKKAVLKMVRLILGTPRLDVIDDASDALAVAIVAANKLGYS